MRFGPVDAAYAAHGARSGHVWERENMETGASATSGRLCCTHMYRWGQYGPN